LLIADQLGVREDGHELGAGIAVDVAIEGARLGANGGDQAAATPDGIVCRGACLRRDGWPDRHAPVAVSAARIAIAAAVVTKRSRHPNCLVKTCPLGQEIGRSKPSVQQQCQSQFFVQSAASHRIHTTTASFLASDPGFMLELQTDVSKATLHAATT
jgi:hypothetical protein